MASSNFSPLTDSVHQLLITMSPLLISSLTLELSGDPFWGQCLYKTG